MVVDVQFKDGTERTYRYVAGVHFVSDDNTLVINRRLVRHKKNYLYEVVLSFDDIWYMTARENQTG